MPTTTTISDYYEYAKLATAAYINLDGQATDESTIANLADRQERLPRSLANQTFDGSSTQANSQPVWKIPNFGANGSGYFGNDAEGFAATLFERTNSDGSIDKVLAIRGTEPETNEDLYKADIGQIGFFGLALGQAVSMLNLMRRLRAPAGSPVQQLDWHISATEPNSVPSVRIPDDKGWLDSKGTDSFEPRCAPNRSVPFALRPRERWSPAGM